MNCYSLLHHHHRHQSETSVQPISVLKSLQREEWQIDEGLLQTDCCHKFFGSLVMELVEASWQRMAAAGG